MEVAAGVVDQGDVEQQGSGRKVGGRSGGSWLAGWALAALILCAMFGPAALRQDFAEPDNALRLVQVRDLLAGQPWFDLVQHRMGGEAGVPMHWARWIDGAIALPILLLTFVAGPVGAEIVVAFLWPLGLLAIFMVLNAALCRKLARPEQGNQAALIGSLLAALAFPAMDRFAPGAFDHHNVVLVLCLAGMLGMASAASRPRAALLAGIALMTAAATAAEAIPFILVGTVVMGALWLFRSDTGGREAGHALGWFGAGAAAAACVSFLVLVPPAAWSAPVCDAMSRSVLGLGLVLGGACMALGWGLPAAMHASLGRRVAVAGITATVGAAGLLVAFPECRGGAYGDMSGVLRSEWLVQIAEARSIFRLAADDIGLMLGLCGVGLFGLVGAVRRLVLAPRDEAAWVIAAFLLAAVAIMVWQVRGAAFAAAFAVPLLAGWVADKRELYRAAPTPRRLLAFLGVGALSAAAFWSAAGARIGDLAQGAPQRAAASTSAGETRACVSAEALRPLGALPAGRVLNEFSLGPAILLHSGHTVLAAPYHRNEAGLIAAMTAFREEAEAAEVRVAALGVSYVVVCAASPEAEFHAERSNAGVAPDRTLGARLAAGHPPGWLQALTAEDASLRIYRLKAPPVAQAP